MHSYLLTSATQNKSVDFDEISETSVLLFDIYQSLVDGRGDLDITAILFKCADILNAENAKIFLIDVSTNTLKSQYSTSEQVNAESTDFRKGIAGKVFSNPETTNIYKTNLNEFTTENQLKSVLAVPLFNRFKKVIGVLKFSNKKGQSRFTIHDESMANIFGGLLSNFFLYFNPVHSSSKLNHFNPGLKNNFINLLDMDEGPTLQLIQKLKNSLENVIMNHESKETLEVILEE